MLDTPPDNVLNTNIIEVQKRHGFRYVGLSPLLVKGAITSRSYLFQHEGDVLSIDDRDIPAMMAEPLLQKVLLER